MSNNDIKSNNDIVEQASRLLEENRKEWEDRYDRYTKEIDLDKYAEDRKKFRIPKPLNAYSCISRVKQTHEDTTSFDLRYQGQSIGEIIVKKEEVFLNTKGKEKKNSKYFQYSKLRNSDNRIEWNSTDAREFRKHFMSLDKSNAHSPEHKIEQFLLSEFSKKTRSSEKKLCSIQPVRLGGLFFQMPTPLKASDHSKGQIYLEYENQYGGGIDILARIKDKYNNPKLAVFELKDENTEREPQKEVMWQALAYATFIAYLLRSKSGTFWWEKVFGFKEGSLSKDKPLEIIVATIMPGREGTESLEGELDKIPIKGLNVKLIPQTLYFNKDENGNPTSFYGTFKDNLYKKGE